QGGFLSALEHPIIAGKFLILVVGEVVDAQINRIGFSGVGSRGAFDLGLVILLGVIVTLAAYGLRRDDSSGRPIGVVLICFGLLFAATITEGRLFEGGIFAGFGNANQPR